MSNPLVVQPKDDTKAFSGIQIAESVADTKKAIESGDWAGGVLGVVGTALDALGTAMDPFGAILSAGVGWLIEHVGPLSDALDELTGDPEQIKAHSETWKKVASELTAIKTELADSIKKDTEEWKGEAADSYRKRGEDTGNLLTAAESASSGAAEGVGTAGEVVGAVRTMVRDIIADLVGHLVSWALQVIATLGIAMAWVVPQVVNAVVKTASQIADITKKLVKAMQKLKPLLKKLGDGFKDAGDALKKIKADGGKSPGPKPPPGGKDKGGDPPPNEKGPDGTSSQSTDSPPPKNDGAPPPKNNPQSERSPDGGGGPSPGQTNPNSTKGTSKGSPDETNSQGARNQQSSPRSQDKMSTTGDPIDVSTGQMVLTQVDARFEDALDLEISRTHFSKYRLGRWFGRSWVSTLDERLEVDGAGISYISADGTLQHFPHPTSEAPVYSDNGRRRALTRTSEGGYVIDDVTRECGLYFAPGTSSVRPLTLLSGQKHEIALEYDETGVPTRIRHSDGYHIRVESKDDRVTALFAVTSDGAEIELMRYGYTDGQLTEVINASREPLRYEYDSDGRIVRWVDRNGMWYRFTYDETGRCVRGEGAGGFLNCSIRYDAENRITDSTDSLGHSTTFYLNEAGQVIKEVDPLGNAIESEWDAYDRLLRRTDPLGRTTAYEYDERSRVSAITRPDGLTLVVQHGGSTVSVSADGETTSQRTYDRAEFPDPGKAQVGVATPFRYERSEQESAIDSVHSRDALGRPADARNVAGGRVRTSWTVDGRRISATGPQGAHRLWRYDGEGNEIERIDEFGHVSRAEYGAFDYPIATTDGTGARTVYSYDTELRMTSVTNPQGLVWSYAYDLAGRLVQEIDFDGRILRYTYDAAGQIRTATNALGEVTEFEHDVLGQVIERRISSGSTTYSYDPLGNLIAAVNPDAELRYEWDESGRVTAETINGRTVTFSYSEDGQQERRVTPSGVESVWTYGENGVPLSLTSAGHTIEFHHDGGGKEIRRSVDDTLVLSQEFDPEHRLANQIVTAHRGQPVQRRRFEYRPDGYLVGRHHNNRPERITLDQNGRVTDVIAPDRRENYRYDAAGNVVVGPLGQYHYSRNTLLSAGAVSFEYDAQGRMVQRRVNGPNGGRLWRFTWDAHDRMTGVITPDGARWRYRYDALGRRIAKQRFAADESTVVEQIEYVWDGPLLIEQLHTSKGAAAWVTTWEYHPSDDRPLIQLDSSGAFFSIITDTVGTPTELYDGNGQLSWRNRSTVWGQVTERDAITPLRFPGQYADPETELHYNVYRYYDPVIGRYVSQDPLGLEPALNPVSYVVNPHRTADPLGLMDCSGGGSGGGKRPPPVPPRPSPKTVEIAKQRKREREQQQQQQQQQPQQQQQQQQNAPVKNYPQHGERVESPGTFYRSDDRPPSKIQSDGGFQPHKPQSPAELRQDISNKGGNTWQQEHVSGNPGKMVSTGTNQETGGMSKKYMYEIETGPMYKFPPNNGGTQINPHPNLYADNQDLGAAQRIGVESRTNRIPEADFNNVPADEIKRYKGPGDSDFKDMPGGGSS